MICGTIFLNSLQGDCLGKGVSDVKNSELLCLKGKEGKCKAVCSREMASVALAYAGAAQTSPGGNKGYKKET